MRDPLLVYDGKCRFCGVWIEYWNRLTGDRVDYATFQEAASRFPEVPLERFQTSVQLILPNGRVLSGAHAVFQSLAFAPGKGWMLWSYERIPGVAWISEWFYNIVATHRDFFYLVTRLLWGERLAPSTDALVRWFFFRALGLIYLIAFASFGVQVLGLIGSNGILPVGDFLQWINATFGVRGYWLAPTIFWVNSGDLFLRLVPIAGAGLALLLLIGFTHRLILLLLYLAYLSLVTAGQDFMSFQWDILLLETGFLAIFLVGSSSVTLWLFRWLLFRLIFLSGAVKLLSGDPTWRNLTALDFHFETQPLPTVVGWYFHQLPAWFHRISVLAMFAIELGAPFLILAPRRLRFLSAASIVFLQVLILLTGNYAFFNLLAISLCLLLLDDAVLRRVLPQGLARRIPAPKPESPLGRFVLTVSAVVILLISGFQLVGIFALRMPAPVGAVANFVAPFHIANTYGLFAVMTTSRPEIIVEGSNDGLTWLEYGFKYKPGDVQRAPVWVEPHQPRLDWQMWFAALGSFSDKPWLTDRLIRANPSAAFWLSNYNVDPWFISFMLRLLQGSPEVLALLDKNPFPGAPPHYVRAMLYNYQFTDVATLHASGAWWQRDRTGLYFPAISR
jgi:predicted DCC family thiol-disulfide oxidoreductase YuxK